MQFLNLEVKGCAVIGTSTTLWTHCGNGRFEHKNNPPPNDQAGKVIWIRACSMLAVLVLAGFSLYCSFIEHGIHTHRTGTHHAKILPKMLDSCSAIVKSSTRTTRRLVFVGVFFVCVALCGRLFRLCRSCDRLFRLLISLWASLSSMLLFVGVFFVCVALCGRVFRLRISLWASSSLCSSLCSLFLSS